MLPRETEDMERRGELPELHSRRSHEESVPKELKLELREKMERL